ncbi:Protein SABRE [Coemansia spiralis]|uniref:Protein SABRE n=1 Tax=Coemansia spiralis TaxID=417178 RepID=A0A9W8GAJ8_9FUNG|nr:Protein SABRE [Coemansia spiralis]
MRLTFLVLLGIAILSVLLPLPRQYVDDGSVIHETFVALRIPSSVLRLVLHPVCITPLLHFIALRALHFLLSIPVRMFLSGFGLDIRSFSGTSFTGLLLSFQLKNKMEVILRVDEVGFDIRTMRRLRMRIRSRWIQLKRYFYAQSSGLPPQSGLDPGQHETNTQPRDSTDSVPPTEPLIPGVERDSPAGSNSSYASTSGLSKRLQLYARGVHLQLYVLPSQKAKGDDSDESMWFDLDSKEEYKEEEEEEETAASNPRSSVFAKHGSRAPADFNSGSDTAKKPAGEKQVLDSEAQQVAAKLARNISTTLRTYTYFASLFARWVDISISDISIKVVRSNEMARAGHGVTLYMSNVMLWAESARKSQAGGSNGNASRGWIPADIMSSLGGIVSWLFSLVGIRRNRLHEEPSMPLDSADPEAEAEHMPRNISNRRSLRERLHRLSSGRGLRDRSQKYLSTLALEVSGIRLFPGIEGVQQHMNSRWELVKLLVMQDMLPSKTPSGDADQPHHRGPVLNCQRCTIRNDVITSFWGLPKKVDQHIELGQVHVRAGILEALLDEAAVMCIDPAARASSLSIHGLRALSSHLASVLQKYDRDISSDSKNADMTGSIIADFDSGSIRKSEREQINRMLFQLHEILSRLRLEHVGIALRMPELVFDLPLSPDPRSLIVRAPAMLRWRQRNIEVECGYMWNSISSGFGSRVSTVKLHSEGRRSAAPVSDIDADEGKDEDADSPRFIWSEDAKDMFARDFEGEYLRRPKDSTAFIRISSGQVQMIALRTPSMTPDTRAEELVPGSPGFRLRYFTLYGEMSAFLSEDLSQCPSPQPIFTLEISKPELLLDLQTQLAIDEAKVWAKHMGHRFKVMRRILKHIKPKGTQPNAPGAQHDVNHHIHGLISLIFADVKAHIVIERATYAVLPHVPLQKLDSISKDEQGDRISLSIRHAECHVLWNLSNPTDHTTKYQDNDASSDTDSFVTGKGSPQNSPELEKNKVHTSDNATDRDILTPLIQFRCTTSPITARWEQQAPATVGKEDRVQRTLFQVKHGVRARGTAGLYLGQPTAATSLPRANINVDAEIGEAIGMIRDYEFRKWLSMQPLWLVTELMRISGLDYKGRGASPQPASSLNPEDASKSDDTYILPPVEVRRKGLTATFHMLFESLRLTIMASDNEEDVLSGIEHGTQICLNHGFVDLRANGGSLESPHQFGFRPDVARVTLNIECQRATMFLLAAVSASAARPEVARQNYSHYTDLSVNDLCGYLPDTVNQHIVLVRPQFNYSNRKLEPYRSCLIFDLTTASFSGNTCVSSVYRWSVFMHHIKYWLRRKKLARRMATQSIAPSPPDDILVYINSDLLDLEGDLVSPLFFNLETGLAESFKSEYNEASVEKQSPRMKLKMPQVRFNIEKTTQETDNDLTIAIRSPIATLYGSSTPRGQKTRCAMQPLMSLKECKLSFRFPRKTKRAQLAADNGVRCNSTYSHIDIAFERGAMAFGHRYNMAETIDGYFLMQKGCKRIARQSSSTCCPPLPFPEEALNQRPTAKMVLSALGDSRTMMPPPLRSMTNAQPPPPPMLIEPDDIPKIAFHGPEFSLMVHDDPFETALSRIYQVGLHEQRERLNRLESFNTKADELRKRREQEFLQQKAAVKKNSRELHQAKGKHAKGSQGHRHKRGNNNKPFKGGRMLRGASTFTSSERVNSKAWDNMHTGLPYSSTFTSAQLNSRSKEPATASSLGFSFGRNTSTNGIASMSMQDVTLSGTNIEVKPRNRTNSAAAETIARSYTSLSGDVVAPAAACEGGQTVNGGDVDAEDEDERCYEDVATDDHLPDNYQQMANVVNAEIGAAYQRLMAVEAREWVKAIRKKMMPPHIYDENEQLDDGMDFGEIFEMPTTASANYPEQRCGSPSALPPYSYTPSSWTHPSVPLGHLLMTPVWISLDTPLSLLEFAQIESYLRYLDPTTPHDLRWSTLVPTHLRMKCGEIRMQLRDFPFPFFKVPDPYRSETEDVSLQKETSYDSFYGGIEISGSLIIAERAAHERSLRSVYIPVGPRSKESVADIPNVGWYLTKSLQFPRIFSSLSIMMFSAPTDNRGEGIMSFQHKYLQSRLPPLPIMSTWGASYQPVISAFMQRIESATSKSADISPSLPWWDKLRSRMHVRCRMAVINAPPVSELPVAPDSIFSADDLGISVPDNATKEEQQTPKKSSEKGAVSANLTKEMGQMFFLALDGRDPYQVTQKPGSYLFTMRGGVRFCLNEGIPGSELWDKVSGRGIYSVPMEGVVPPSGTLGEFLRLRCEEFLMGVPIIVDRQSMLLKSIDPLFGVGSETAEESTPNMDDLDIEEALPQSDPLSWKKAYSDLLRSISRANSARYTFATQHIHQLYHKVMQHLSGGVRLGIGISSFIPPDRHGFRHNHWDVQPIAPENATAMTSMGIRDAYTGFRSSKLHTSISLLCPFTEKVVHKMQKPFADLYLVRNPCFHINGSGLASANENSKDHLHRILRLRHPDASVLAKPPKQWNVYDTDSLVSPMHTLFTGEFGNVGALSDTSDGPLSAHDLFFAPFLRDSKDSLGGDPAPAAFTSTSRTEHMKKNASTKPQCQISASAAIVEGVMHYLPLFVARMMLPVRKESSDNKLGKCLRSMRLVLDLKNVELAYSQRDFEVKELETRELAILGYGDPTRDIGLSPTPSDGGNGSGGQGVSGAKAEGTVCELKARVESFSFNLLLEQSSVKLQVGTKGPSAASSVQPNAAAAASPDTLSTSHFGNRLSSKKTQPGASLIDQPPLNRPKRKPEGQRPTFLSRPESGVKIAGTGTAETNVLRWGVGDASLEIDYLDVRITQMAFGMPVFMNTLSSDLFRNCKRYNSLWFDNDTFGTLSDFERSWISNSSIRDLKELDISEAIFSNPSVICVLWSPRMVYFTQRPEWTHFGDMLDEILDSNIGAIGSLSSPKADVDSVMLNQSELPSASTADTHNLNQHLSHQTDLLNGPDTANTATSSAYPFTDRHEANDQLLLQRSLSASRSRAMSDLRQIGRASRPSTSGSGALVATDDESDTAAHRRNTSMPWLPNRNPSYDGNAPNAQNNNSAHPSMLQTVPSQPAQPQNHFGFLGNIFPIPQQPQKSATLPATATVPIPPGSVPHSADIQSASIVDPVNENKSPSSAMQYKSSYHLLGLARSRQRRLTQSNSRQSLGIITSPTQKPRDPAIELGTADLQRQQSITVEQTLSSNSQMSKMMPTGPDPKVIMRDSRSTQAMLLCKRKEMLGTAIQHEQAALEALSHEFERASSRHNELFRREMLRKAEHIYELVARRKLINRCLRFLGVDPDGGGLKQQTDSLDFDEDNGELDRDTQQVEKILASLYRHRCLIYSGYLIWTTQVRDKLMRFLYIQDCLTAISYYMSETATKVVRKGASSKGQENADIAKSVPATPKTAGNSATLLADRDTPAGRQKQSSKQVDRSAERQQFLSPPPRDGKYQSRKRSSSTGQNSTASASSNRTLHIPGILRHLRSHERLSDNGTNESTKVSSWISKVPGLGRQKSTNSNARKQKHKVKAESKQKPKERRKEEYKLSKRKMVDNKFDRGLKGVWDDFMRYRPYYSILVEFLNSQVSMRVDENESTTSAIAVAERVQLHRILLCNESDYADDIVPDGSGNIHVVPPEDESIVKTRSLIELENVQVFTAKRDDFKNLPAYFVDCTYGSRLNGDSSKPSTIWPAWIPIELLLSQSKQKNRSIFEGLEDEEQVQKNRYDNSETSSSDSVSDSDIDNGSDMTGVNVEYSANSRSHTSHKKGEKATTRRNSRRRKAWWLEDLSKYKRLMDRNNGLVVYDKANPHRIQGDTSDRFSMSAGDEEPGSDMAKDLISRSNDAEADKESDIAAEATAANASERTADEESRRGSFDQAGEDLAADTRSTLSFADSIDDAEVTGSNQGLSHRANHISVFLPDLNLACTAEQYTAVYETVTDLLVFIDPEKAAYMDHLNTILLGMDMSDLRGLLSVIQATQEALRERMPVIHDWYTIQHSNVILFREAKRTMFNGGRSWSDRAFDSTRQRLQANSLLTLDRHRRALEQQLRTAMDIFGAAQKQMKQQHKLEDQGKLANSRLQYPDVDDSMASGSAYVKGYGSTEEDHTTAPEGRSKRNISISNKSHSPAVSARRRMSHTSALSASSPSLLSSCSSERNAAEENHSAIARTIHLFISKATWHMLENDEQPLCDLTLRWASLKAVTTSDQATHLLSEIHLLYIVNRLPDPMFTDLVGPYIRPKHPRPDFCVEKMIRVRWSELAPVGGISIVERFEVDLFPIRLQLSHDIAQKLINYLYPPQDNSTSSSNNVGGGGDDQNVLIRNDAGAAYKNIDTSTSVSPMHSKRTAAFGSDGEGGPIATSTQLPISSTASAAVGAGAANIVGGGSGSKSLFASRLRRNLDDHARSAGSESLRGTSAPHSSSATPVPEADSRLPPSGSQSPQQATGVLPSFSGRSTPLSLFSESNAMIGMSRGSDNRSQVDQMKKRASSNKTFLNIKIGGSTLCISYQGKKASNITDLRDFEFHAPTLELRNQVESYYELLMQVKKEYMSVVVHHTGALVKEKFRQLHNRKAWSKSSFGPDWEARKLLIEMDRRVEQDLAANSNAGDMSDREAYSSVNATLLPPVSSGADEANGTAQESAIEVDASGSSIAPSSRANSQPSVSRPIQPPSVYPGNSNRSVTASSRDQALTGDSDDAASTRSTKSKAPLSKYMILDPRKLMGKRLPGVLPRNSSLAASGSTVMSLMKQRSDTPDNDGRYNYHGQRTDSYSGGGGLDARSSVAPSMQPNTSGSRPPLYSIMHMDMLPAASSPNTGLAAYMQPSASARVARTAASPSPLLPRRLTSDAPSASSSLSMEPSKNIGNPPILVRRATSTSAPDSNDDGSYDGSSKGKEKAKTESEDTTNT